MHNVSVSRSPASLRHIWHVQARYASTTKNPNDTSDVTFPFPHHRNPTPHEILHLPRGASQREIKARYYELVRIHHPDCAAARKLLPGTSHIHFQAISDAYAVLTGKRPSSSWSRNSSSPSSSGYASDTAFYEEITRRKRAQWRAPAGSDEFGYGPDVWDKKEKEMFDQGTLVFIMVFALIATIVPISILSPFGMGYKRHDEASKNLAEARREAREIAEVRRLALMGQSESERCNGDPDT